MKDSQIKDIPQIKKVVDDIKNMQSLKVAMPVLAPLLRLMGVDTTQMHEALGKVDDLARMAEELSTLPDRFNDLFAPRGWIIYDLLNIEVAKSAVTKAEAGDFDSAESDLVAYYDADTVRWQLQMMHAIKAFRARVPLAQKALIDYNEERYHACVPVILALMDGLVSELHEKRRGFSAEDVDLKVWDSFAGHDTGLTALAKIFQTGRRTTQTEQISIPYRHGILHGMDLGYDNKIVAAKTWAALFAIREWALKVEKGETKPPPEQPKPSLRETARDLFHQIQEHSRKQADFDARFKAWTPRTIHVSTDIPASGLPDVFEEGTPERKLAEFFSLWAKGNFGHMAQYCLTVSDKKYYGKKLPLRLKERFAAKRFRAFEIIEIQDEAPALTVIKAKVVYEESGKDVEVIKDFRLICEDAAGKPVIRGKPGGSWVLYTSYV